MIMQALVLGKDQVTGRTKLDVDVVFLDVTHEHGIVERAETMPDPRGASVFESLPHVFRPGPFACMDFDSESGFMKIGKNIRIRLNGIRLF